LRARVSARAFFSINMILIYKSRLFSLSTVTARIKILILPSQYFDRPNPHAFSTRLSLLGDKELG